MNSTTLLELETMPLDEKERFLNRLALEIGSKHRAFQPRFPWVLVRVLPKDGLYHNLIQLPEKQNKVSWEGIVLSTWQPFSQRLYTSQGHSYVAKASALNAGDHVLFPHWSGLPIPGYDDKEYRMVKEEGWTKDGDGGIYATLEYDASASLEQFGKEFHTIPNEDEYYRRGAGDMLDAIRQRYILVDRRQRAVTLSGV